MKQSYFLTAALTALMATALTACDDEKDLVVIEGNLPIKASALYMLGDATPNGWDNGNPTPFTAGEEDNLVFSWEGNLNVGEMKLCLVAGSWDVPFIRPLVNGTEISSTDLTDETFGMHAGDPDDKWKVTEAGKYRLTFNLRDWTMSTRYLGGADKPAIEPIEVESLYMVGSATPNGWDIDNPTELTSHSKYVYVYEGDMVPGEMKICAQKGTWDQSFVRPASDGVAIDRDGVAEEDFVYTANPDNKWNVKVDGKWRLTVDLENWKIKAELLEEHTIEKTPIEAEAVYMIGTATPGGWSLDDAAAYTVDPADSYVFVWEGDLAEGSMKACVEKSFDAPFIRPTQADVEIGANGVASPDFVFTTGPDDQWKVVKAGHYKLTLNLKDWTIKAEYTDNGEEPVDPTPGKDALESETDRKSVV